MTYFSTKVYDIDLEEIVVRDTTTLYSEHSHAYFYLASLKPLIISVVTNSSSVEENIKTKNVIGMDTITKANLETIIIGTDNLLSQVDQLQAARNTENVNNSVLRRRY